MSVLLEQPPFAPRDDARFLAEMNELTHWHRDGCPEFRRLCPEFVRAQSINGLPFVHVGLFKRLLLKTGASSLRHTRTLTSSSTTGASPSRIVLDEFSSEGQSRSSLAILEAMVGAKPRPLLILDSAASLRLRGEMSARIAAAMSLKPLSTEFHFLMADPNRPETVRWDEVARVIARERRVLVYGLSSLLWLAWARAEKPTYVAEALNGATVHFVHSGGWKKLEAMKVGSAEFNTGLLQGLSSDSRVVDFYGLVEQVGVVFPLCPAGNRHSPRWAEVIVRDPWSLEPLVGKVGLLQLMNVLPRGGPYHNVLTEDMGRVLPGDCPCGFVGRRFELFGRIPHADVRGCGNV